jgi:hypothetical protein
MIAAAVYFFVVLPLNAHAERRSRGEVVSDPTTKKCPECLSEIPVAARRCAFCTSPPPVGRTLKNSVPDRIIRFNKQRYSTLDKEKLWISAK